MNIHFMKFPAPVLDEESCALYAELYGEKSREMLATLEAAPDEIAVISRLIACLTQDREES